MRTARVAFAAMLLVGIATVAQAQTPQGQGQGQRMGGGRNMAALMTGITLSAEQQVKFDSLSTKNTEARQAMMADQTTDMDTRRTKMRELMTRQQDDIKAILTDDQKKVFEKNVADMQARMPQGGGRPPRS